VQSSQVTISLSAASRRVGAVGGRRSHPGPAGRRGLRRYELHQQKAKSALDSGEAAELKAAEAKGRAGDPKGIAKNPQ
jgi:hypothetical protein